MTVGRGMGDAMTADTDPLLIFTMDGTVTPATRLAVPDRFSYSTLHAWSQCAGRWAADRLVERAPQPADPLLLGTIVHRAIQTAMDTPATDPPDWRTLTADAIRRLRAEDDGRDPAPPIPLPDGGRATDEYWARLAWLKIRHFRLTDALGRPPRPAALEEHVEGVWDGIRLHGYVDYRDDAGILIDWKTGRIPSFPDAARAHGDQLRLYAHLLDAMGVPIRSARDVYVEHRDFRPVDLSKAAIDDTRRRLTATATRMADILGAARQRLPLTPSPLCPWCPLANVCPAARIDTAKGRAAAAAQPVRAADARFVRTHGTGGMNGKEHGMDLSAYLMGEAAASAPTHTDPPENTTDRQSVPDPWATPAGREALAQWGITDETEGSGGNTAATPPDDPDGHTTPTGAPSATSADGPGMVRVCERRPWEPTWDGARLNPAGYGWSRWADITAAAIELDGDDPHTVAMLIVQGAWAAARTALGTDGAPDIDGLADGRPDGVALFAWLDTAIARDTLRILHTLLTQETTGSARERVGRAARRAATAWETMLTPLTGR